MNPADVISAADLDGGDFAGPTYYCETCGKEISYPAATGRCATCDETYDLDHFDDDNAQK